MDDGRSMHAVKGSLATPHRVNGGSRKTWHEDSDDAAASGQRLGGMAGEELTECERDRFRKGA